MKPDISHSTPPFPVSATDGQPITLLGGESSEFSSSVGTMLRVAREKAGLSLGDVASRLRMGVKQVRSLEDDDYPALPKGTFLRGFVRNFAKEVGIKPEAALSLLEETHKPAAPISASVIVMPSQQNISVPPSGGELVTPRARFVIAVAIACLLLTVVWWWWEYVRPYRADGGRPKVVAAEQAVAVPIEVSVPAVRSVATEDHAARAIEPVPSIVTQLEEKSSDIAPPFKPAAAPATTSVTPSPPRTDSAAPVQTRPSMVAGRGQLGLTFSGKSWVEVVDGAGKTVLDKIFKDGEAEEVIGLPPFTVVIGNAQATRMAYNGKEVDLTPHTRASVARMTVK